MFSQVRRSLLELLKSCGLPWKLTSRHILTALLNLGLNPVMQYGLGYDLACSHVLPQNESDNNLQAFYLKASKHKVRQNIVKL